MRGTNRVRRAAGPPPWRAAGVLGALGLAAVMGACGSSGTTPAGPTPTPSTVPALTPSTTASDVPTTTVVVPAPASSAVYLDALRPVLASANLRVTLALSASGTNDELDLVAGRGVEVDATSGYGQALVNLAGVGYEDNQGGSGTLIRLPGADPLTVAGVQAALTADLSGVTAVQMVTPDLLDVTFTSDPVASLRAQVAQVAASPGVLPSATTGGPVTDQVDLTGGSVTEILGVDQGRSGTLSLVPGAATLPPAP